MESIVTEIIGEKAFVFKPPIASLFLEALTMGPIEWESTWGAREWVSFFLLCICLLLQFCGRSYFQGSVGWEVFRYKYICIISEYSIFH